MTYQSKLIMKYKPCQSCGG